MAIIETGKTVKELFKTIGEADCIWTATKSGPRYLREIADGDVCLIDTESTDYNGRICSATTPEYKTSCYVRLYIDGEDVTVCDATDGDVLERCKVDEIKVGGIVTAIVRRMEPVQMNAADLDQHKPLFDKIKAGMDGSNRYMLQWEEMEAIKQKERGSLFGSLYAGFFYGFYQGRKAERNAAKRKRKAARKEVNA